MTLSGIQLGQLPTDIDIDIDYEVDVDDVIVTSPGTGVVINIPSGVSSGRVSHYTVVDTQFYFRIFNNYLYTDIIQILHFSTNGFTVNLTFSYAKPVISTASSTQDNVLELFGLNFGDGTDLSTVTVAGSLCNMTFINDTYISCELEITSNSPAILTVGNQQANFVAPPPPNEVRILMENSRKILKATDICVTAVAHRNDCRTQVRHFCTSDVRKERYDYS